MLSICMIVKNEEKILKTCLKNIFKFIGVNEYKLKEKYELVIVDTGSTDKTKEIAKKYTENVYFFKWCNDFSKARNFAASKAKYNHILVIDADEILCKFDEAYIENYILKYPDAIGLIKKIEIIKDEITGKYEDAKDNYDVRFYSKKFYKFERRIHEQLIRLDNKKIVGDKIPIFVKHVGYTNVNQEEKIERFKRNDILLREEINENGENSYDLYQIAQNYNYVGETKEALFYADKALRYDLNLKAQYALDLIILAMKLNLKLNYFKRAKKFLKYYDNFSDSADFLYYSGIIYLNNEQFDLAIRNFEKATKIKTCIKKGVNSYLSYYNLGIIYEFTGKNKEAVDYYSKCKDFHLAKERIKKLL